MIKNLDEINRLLFVFDQYEITAIEEDGLLKQMSGSPVVTQAALDHRPTIEFCLSAKILESAGGKLSLTRYGLHLTALAKAKNPSYLVDIKPKQCDFLNRNVFLSPDFNSPIKPVLRDYFENDGTRKSWRYEYAGNGPLPLEFMEYVNLLKQSGLLLERYGVYEIDPQYSPHVSALLSEGHPLTQAELEQILEEKKKTGQRAESFALRHERRRLREMHCEEEARRVELVSDWDVAAGFDIKSFDGSSRTMEHNMFIEVKGSAESKLRFIWSANEVAKAKHLREKYWLYFVGGLDEGKVPKLQTFKDPFRTILGSRRFLKKCIGYEVTAAQQVGGVVS